MSDSFYNLNTPTSLRPLTPHPSEVQLLAYLETGKDAPWIRAHVMRCASCRSALVRLLPVVDARESSRWARQDSISATSYVSRVG